MENRCAKDWNEMSQYVDKYKKKSIPRDVSPIEMILNDKFIECSTSEETYELRKNYVNYLDLLVEEKLSRLIDEE